MDCSPPGFSVHGILQAWILKWVAMSSSRGIFLIQGLNPFLLCLLYWQVDSLPLVTPGKPRYIHTPVQTICMARLMKKPYNPENNNDCDLKILTIRLLLHILLTSTALRTRSFYPPFSMRKKKIVNDTVSKWVQNQLDLWLPRQRALSNKLHHRERWNWCFMSFLWALFSTVSDFSPRYQCLVVIQVLGPCRVRVLWLVFTLIFPIPHESFAHPTTDQSAWIQKQTHISGLCWTNLSEDRLVNGEPASPAVIK